MCLLVNGLCFRCSCARGRFHRHVYGIDFDPARRSLLFRPSYLCCSYRKRFQVHRTRRGGLSYWKAGKRRTVIRFQLFRPIPSRQNIRHSRRRDSPRVQHQHHLPPPPRPQPPHHHHHLLQVRWWWKVVLVVMGAVVGDRCCCCCCCWLSFFVCAR